MNQDLSQDEFIDHKVLYTCTCLVIQEKTIYIICLPAGHVQMY